MTVKLNRDALENAKKLIREGKFVKDEKDAWSSHAPTTDEENSFIAQHGMDAYEQWFLGKKADENTDNKTAWEFPFGDFSKVHRGGVIAAKVRAGQYHHQEIEHAANDLLQMIDTA